MFSFTNRPVGNSKYSKGPQWRNKAGYRMQKKRIAQLFYPYFLGRQRDPYKCSACKQYGHNKDSSICPVKLQSWFPSLFVILVCMCVWPLTMDTLFVTITISLHSLLFFCSCIVKSYVNQQKYFNSKWIPGVFLRSVFNVRMIRNAN